MAHADPVAFVALALAVILATAKLGGHLAERVGQPAVLGELLVGVLLGNLGHLGIGWLESIKADSNVDMLARLGVIILLFEVGLESTVREMLKVGPRSLVVAVLGVVAPRSWGGAWARCCSRSTASTCTPSSARRSPRPAWASPHASSGISGGPSRRRRG